MKMENSNVKVSVDVVQKKSNAAWICGLIGFITSLPNSLCALICAGATTAAAGLSAGLSAKGADFDPAAADAAAAKAATGASGLLWTVLAISVICFILSFMGKYFRLFPIISDYFRYSINTYRPCRLRRPLLPQPPRLPRDLSYRQLPTRW